jgi:hypothetical protein
MGFLKSLFGARGDITPEELGKWIVPKQRYFVDTLMRAVGTTTPETQELLPMNLPSNESLLAIPFHAYSVQLAIICGYFHLQIDDSMYFKDTMKTGMPDLMTVAGRIHASAGRHAPRTLEQRLLQFSPVVTQFEHIRSYVVGYYGSIFMSLEQFRMVQPLNYGFARHMINQMQTTNQVVNPIAFAYREAFALTVPNKAAHLVPSEGTPDDEIAPIMATVYRTWIPWVTYLLNFTKELDSFAANRKPRFA